MNLRFRDFSIRIKITLLTFIVSLVAIIISVIIFFNYDRSTYIDKTTRDLEILAEVISKHNDANIQFDGHAEADNYLDALAADKLIKTAILFDTVTTDEPFAYFDRDTLYPAEIPDKPLYKDTSYVENNQVIIYKPVKVNNATIGVIYLTASLEGYSERVKKFLFVILIIIIAVPAISFLFSLKLQKFITSPVNKLLETMRYISQKGDYSQRISVTNRDEIGALTKEFNTMISHIEQQNKELYTAKQKAEDSVKAKDQFMARMSHEIRTPMNTIMGMTDMLLENNLSKEQLNHLENIKVSANNLLEIINDILDFSKIEAGELPMENAVFDLPKQINYFKNSVEFKVQKKELDFTINAPYDSLPQYVKGDSVRLNQVLLNLVSNAIKFTDEGYVNLDISLKEEAEDYYNICFTVSDTGIGIPPDKIAEIFQSFKQADSDTKRKYGGTGLGLAISKQLVDMMGGGISVKSTHGSGSTFSFNVILNKVSDAEIQEENRDKTEYLLKIYQQSLETKGKIKVLLVEDNKMNQMLASSILQKNNFETYFATNGREALDQIYNNTYNVVLMDIHMPVMDGYEAVHEIRDSAHKKINSLPVIALTAAATKQEITKAYETGMDDFISKPFKKEELINKILKITLNTS